MAAGVPRQDGQELNPENRLGVRRDKIDAELAGSGEIYFRLNHLRRLLPATHDQDLGRKIHAAIGGICTKGFEDLTVQSGELFL
jgi:hypothetical protein